MADLLRLAGSIAIAASSGSPSGHAALAIPVDEQWPVDHARGNLHYLLITDAARVVDLDGLTINFLMVRASAKVRTRITSADGSTQSIPGTFLLLRSEDVPISAVDITRQPAVETSVDITIGVVPT